MLKTSTASIAHLPAVDQKFIRAAAARRAKLAADLNRAIDARRTRLDAAAA
jgi:hypothetical protein